MVPRSAPVADHADAPQVQGQAVDERRARDDGEPPRRRERDVVAAKVEQRRCDGAQDDGELEPGEEGPLGCEIDFGLDAHGDVDPCGREGGVSRCFVLERVFGMEGEQR